MANPQHRWLVAGMDFLSILHLSQSIKYLTNDIIWASDQMIRVSTSRIREWGWVEGLRPQDLCAELVGSSCIPQFLNRTFTYVLFLPITCQSVSEEDIPMTK